MMSKKILLSETKRVATSLELSLSLDITNNEIENYSNVSVSVDKKTNDININTDIGDKFIVNNKSGDISITKANGDKFIIDKKTNTRTKQKK